MLKIVSSDKPFAMISNESTVMKGVQGLKSSISIVSLLYCYVFHHVQFIKKQLDIRILNINLLTISVRLTQSINLIRVCSTNTLLQFSNNCYREHRISNYICQWVYNGFNIILHTGAKFDVKNVFEIHSSMTSDSKKIVNFLNEFHVTIFFCFCCYCYE